MGLRKIMVIAAGAAALLGGCAFPTHDPSKLKAIEAESRILMARPAGASETVPESRWPRAIASLDPELVYVFPDGVDIVVKGQMDGGWGYFVPRDRRTPPVPEAGYSDLGHGVYWHHPY